MKRFVLSVAMVLSVAVPMLATGTHVPVTSLGVSGDKYVFSANTVVSGHNLGLVKTKMQQDISGYYDAGTNAYQVPLSALGWGSYTITNNEVTVEHYVPGSGAGCSGGFCRVDVIIEILD